MDINSNYNLTYIDSTQQLDNTTLNPLLKNESVKTDRVGSQLVKKIAYESTEKEYGEGIPEHLTFASGCVMVPLSINQSVDKFFYGGLGVETPHQQALKLTTIVSIITGAIAGIRGYNEMEQSTKINDNTGWTVGCTNCLRAPFEILGGLILSISGAFSIAATYASTNFFKEQAAVLLKLGTSLTAFTYLFMVVPNWIIYQKHSMFQKKLDKVMHASENTTEAQQYYGGLKCMYEELFLTKEDRKNVIDKVMGEESINSSVANPLQCTNQSNERDDLQVPISELGNVSLSREEERQRKIDHFSLIEKLIQGCSVTSPIISKKEIALQTLQILQSGEFLELQKTLKPEHLKLLKDNIETIKTGYKRSVSENLYYDRLISFLQIDAQEYKGAEDTKELSIDPEDQRLLTPDDESYLIRRTYQKQFSGMDRSRLLQKGRLGIINMKKKKEKEFTRINGNLTANLIKNSAEPLLHLLKEGKGICEAKALFNQIEKERFEYIKQQFMTFGLCTLGIAVNVIATVFSGGIIPAIAAIISVSISLIMFLLDGYSLYQAHKSNVFDTTDQALLFVGNALLMFTVVNALFFTDSLNSLLFTGIVSGIWMVLAACSSGYSYMKSNKDSISESKALAGIKMEPINFRVSDITGR